MSNLEQDIKEAIDTHLSAEIGKRLNDRLMKAEADSIENTLLKKDTETLEKQCKILKDLKHQAEDLDNRSRILKEREQTHIVELTVMDALKQERERAKNQIYDLARIVFDNPKLKFEAGIDIPYRDQAGYMTSHQQYFKGGETTEREHD